MSHSIAFRHYQRVLIQWPVDVLRPSISFQKAIQFRNARRFFPSELLPEDNVIANSVQATIPLQNKVEEIAEIDQVNVLYSLLENRYIQNYPLSPKLMKPASSPTYYVDLIRELQEAPRRSWFGTMINKWKGFLRFS